ncbi:MULTISPECIES: zinc-binding dehydrogenase [unclassified Pseudoalteromonas]|uniref:zinc-binding dehydrogenase n=1 Tax=unclassified Pseudoalteromonas TaxID=194690 RepID=UPI000B3D08C2|nr:MULTISPECIES: zinc-binding dehydrogenase [unclassified Pseudoalteromonas]MDN3377655.1 zinc-binding dehydrogenase [Pseudoalteromonas sp. APC 3893]MDN3385851.1 zinc-binding dehydrogenase [Pseudoalteromonas sp. APC 4017]OUS72825.1 quinone oxidoreductase [Pseudoalteromonas sp. A601]
MKFIAHENKTLSLSETTKPNLQADEVLIKVAAIGVNRADCMQRQGKYPAPKGDSPILGLECAGTVVELGADVEKSWLNQRVFTLCAGGAYSEYVAVDAAQIMALPDSILMEQGASISEVYLTAYGALFGLGNLQQGQTALIHAGASGVGGAAIQMAKRVGATVVITAGSDEKCQHAKELGADHAINYKTDDFVEYMQTHTLTANVIVDPVSGRYLNKNAAIAAMDCQIIMLAFLDSRFAEVDFARLLQKRISFHASTLRNRSKAFKRQLRDEFVNQFYDDIANQHFDFNIYKTMPWQQANEAHAILERNENAGKVVLQVK